MPVSLQAYAAAIAKHPRIQPYFDLIDFSDCKRQYESQAEILSRTWLKQLHLEFKVQDVDVAEFDAPCQFFLFNLAAYLDKAAGRLIRSLPEIETFYVVSEEKPLPLDFYFDSDVPAALLRFACDQAGRGVRQIILGQRTWAFPYTQRPMTMSPTAVHSPAIPEIPAARGSRVGFAPSTSANYQAILDTVRAIDSQVVIFRSTWGMPWIFSGQADYQIDLNDACVEHSSGWARELGQLWNALRSRGKRSALPENVIANPHLEFQLAYIITRRWLSYANMLQRAKELVNRVPLDLFVHSEHFTAEGAMLANFYRQAGTPILIAPHSAWPCDRNWNTGRRSDAAIVFSESAGKRLSQVTGISKVYVTPGTASPRCYSLLGAVPEVDLIETKKKLADGRKVVLVVTNALELLSVPFADLGAHFGTMAVLAEVPPPLRNSVLTAVRTKPQPLGEDPVLYRNLCGFSEESLTFLEGLTFSQCLELADCAIGVNIPTTGYFEIMDRGVPLIHVQIADTVTLHPDLPESVTATVRSTETIWPAIESVLFDLRRREQLLGAQRQFCKNDGGRGRVGGDDSLRNTFIRLTGKSRFRLLPLKKKPQMFGSFPGRIDPRTAPAAQQAGAGHVDDLLSVSKEVAAVAGWAADLVANRPAKLVHIFSRGKHLASGSPDLPRPDVEGVFGQEGLRNSGFLIRIPFRDEVRRGSIEVYAELSDSSIIQLELPQGLKARQAQ